MPPFATATKAPTRFALATLVLLAGASHAQALEGKALFEKLLAESGRKAVTATYGTVTESGPASFSAQNVQLTVEGFSQPTTIQALTVQGLREAADGRITYEAIAISQMEQKNNRGSMTLEGFTSANGDIPVVIFKGPRGDRQPGQAVKFDSLTLSGLSGGNNRNDSTFSMGNLAASKANIPLVYDLEGKKQLTGDDRLQVESFVMNDMTGVGNGSTVRLNSFTIAGLDFPTNAASASPMDYMNGLSAMAMKDFTVSTGGKQLASIASIGAGIQPGGDGEINSRFALEGMKVELAALPDPTARAQMQKLGYDTVEGSMVGVSSYNAKTGVLDLSDLTVDMKDMFKLATNYKVSGYTPELAKQLQQAQLESTRNGVEGPALLMQMLPLLSQLKVDNMTLSLTDKSLVGKLLDMQAQQMGTSGEQLAAGAPMMLGMGMAGLGMPGLTEMVTTAVGKFLQQKGTLTASVTPANPVSVGEIMMASQTDPKKLPDMLNLQVRAD
ncbi:MAG: hypothetical protein AAGK33_06860 [Pseudomonadota bacterium]